MGLAPLDKTISIQALTRDPYPLYKQMRADRPVLRVQALGRTLLTKAADTKHVKDTPTIFSLGRSEHPDEAGVSGRIR